MSIFSALGGFFGKLFGFIKQRISKEQMTAAVLVVQEAAVTFIDNAQRREWAVGMLRKGGLPESLARLAVELAVQEVKRLTAAQAPA